MSVEITSINYCPVKSVSFQSVHNCKIKKNIGIIGDRVFAFAKGLDEDQAKLFEKSPDQRKGKWNKILTLKNSPPLNKYNFEFKDKKLIFTIKDKEILSIDLKACSPFRITEDEINNLSKIHFIYGGKDKLARFNPECDLLKNIDIDKKVHIMPETGHFPFYERPVEFNSLIRKVINL